MAFLQTTHSYFPEINMGSLAFITKILARANNSDKVRKAVNYSIKVKEPYLLSWGMESLLGKMNFILTWCYIS